MNKAYINEWLDDEKEKLEETAEDLKEAYRKDAERVRFFFFFLLTQRIHLSFERFEENYR